MKFVAVFKAVTKNWLRSRSGVFFSFLFPVLFLLVFGSIFGNNSQANYQLTVQNLDINSGPPNLSQIFVKALNSTNVLSVSVISPDTNVTSYIKSKTGYFGSDPRVLIIPKGFQQDLIQGKKVNLTYIYSAADTSAGSVWGIIYSVSQSFQLGLNNVRQQININQISSSVRSLKPVDYYIPGLTAAFMMTNGVIGLTSVASEFRRRGFLKRLYSTPLTKLDWIIGNIISQTILAIALTAVMIAVGILVYHSAVSVNFLAFLSLVSGAVLFSGIGMLLAGLVSDPEAAAGIGNAVAFPMMFLSGIFWPIDIMPSFLQYVAKILPLTYFSESLRDSMLLQDFQVTAINIFVTVAFAIVFIILGSRFTKWSEE